MRLGGGAEAKGKRGASDSATLFFCTATSCIKKMQAGNCSDVNYFYALPGFDAAAGVEDNLVSGL